MTWDPFTKPKAMLAAPRVVRNLDLDRDDDDELPVHAPIRQTASGAAIRPIVAPDAEGELRSTHLRKKEPKMPKGIYDRKPREPKPDAPAAAPRKQARKARTAVAVAKATAVPVNGSKGRFEVSLDLRAGAVTIHAAAGSLALDPEEVMAFLRFLALRPA